MSKRVKQFGERGWKPGDADWQFIIDALFRAAAQDEYVGNQILSGHPFSGESISSRTVGKAFRSRGDRTREYATLLATDEM